MALPKDSTRAPFEKAEKVSSTASQNNKFRETVFFARSCEVQVEFFLQSSVLKIFKPKLRSEYFQIVNSAITWLKDYTFKF